MMRIVAFVQNLSLDITAGALISCLFVGSVFGVEIDNHMLTGLGIAIWLIYTFDHLRDARLSSFRPVNPRHAFHYDHQRVLIGLAALVFCVGIVNAFYLPIETIRLGVLLAMVSGFYFLYIHKSKKQWSKELLAALVYTAGVFTAPFSLLESSSWTYWVIMFQFFLMAYANLMIIPLYELEIDQEDGANSLVRNLGLKKAELAIRLILGLNMLIILVFLGVLGQEERSQLIFMAMMLPLLFLLSKHAFFKKGMLYRIICDGIFFLPAIYFL